MTAPKHAPGKLALRTDPHRPGYALVAIDRPRGPRVIAWVEDMGDGEGEATARRLIAAWNECRSISTDALEAGALRFAQDALEIIAAGRLDHEHDRDAFHDRARREARAALAKLEGR